MVVKHYRNELTGDSIKVYPFITEVNDEETLLSSGYLEAFAGETSGIIFNLNLSNFMIVNLTQINQLKAALTVCENYIETVNNAVEKLKSQRK